MLTRVILVAMITLPLLVLEAGCNAGTLSELRDQNAALGDRIDELESEVHDLREALYEANNQISEAADEIDNAQAYAFGDCETLQIVVQGMDTPEEVSEP